MQRAQSTQGLIVPLSLRPPRTLRLIQRPKSMQQPPQKDTLKIIRIFLVSLFLYGMIGSGLELLLLGHTEDFWQLIPLFLSIFCLLILLWYALSGSAISMRVFQITMITFIVSGLTGVYLHYRGNVEFELEMYPSLQGLDLFLKSIKGATPFLAPGTMIILGLIGLAYSYRHPVFDKKQSR